jgi:hypothetical protein
VHKHTASRLSVASPLVLGKKWSIIEYRGVVLVATLSHTTNPCQQLTKSKQGGPSAPPAALAASEVILVYELNLG